MIYVGLRGKDAENFLKRQPLLITSTQARYIDKAVKSAHLQKLKLKYNAVRGNAKKFEELPAEAQTVIASVSFQYGVGLDVRAPKFWKAVTTQNWQDAVSILRAFGDAYPTRRKKEAALMEKIK